MPSYPGKYTGGRVKKPLDELMQPSGDQKKVTYDGACVGPKARRALAST